MNSTNANATSTTTSFQLPTSVTLTLNGVEMFLSVCTIICCSLFFILLIRVLVFHGNLRILLGNMAIACIIQSTTREMWLAQTIFVADSMNSHKNLLYCWFVVSIHNASLYIVSLSLISLAVERMIATVYAKTYETTQSVKLGTGLVIFQWLFAWGVVFISEYSRRSNGIFGTTCRAQGVMSEFVLLISLYTVLMMSLVAVSVFIVLLYWNKRRYTSTFMNRSIHSLSERYQLSENIKTTRLLYPVVTANAICSLLAIGLLIFIVVYDAESLLAQIVVAISSNIFALLLAFYAAIFPWLSAFGHPELQRELKKMMLCCWKGKVMPSQPRNANGISLILNPGNERSAHFVALQTAWNS